MSADLEEKTDRYESLLAEALDAAEIVPPDGTPLHEAADIPLPSGATTK